MPELPEVETVVREIRSKIVGRSITEAHFTIPRQLQPQTPQQLLRVLKHQTIRAVTRRGKYILIELSKGTLVIHLRMTGRLYVRPESDSSQTHERAWFCLSGKNDRLTFQDARTLGTIHFYPDSDAISEIANLGWEPLSDTVTPDQLKAKLARRSTAIKPVLLDQSIWAGIGNIYASEILWETRIHPEQPANQLTKTQRVNLIAAVPMVLNRALDKGGSTLRNFMSPEGHSGAYQKEFRVYGRDDEPCLRCGHSLQKLVQAQRSTYFCKICQKQR